MRDCVKRLILIRRIHPEPEASIVLLLITSRVMTVISWSAFSLYILRAVFETHYRKTLLYNIPRHFRYSPFFERDVGLPEQSNSTVSPMRRLDSNRIGSVSKYWITSPIIYRYSSIFALSLIRSSNYLYPSSKFAVLFLANSHFLKNFHSILLIFMIFCNIFTENLIFCKFNQQISLNI